MTSILLRISLLLMFSFPLAAQAQLNYWQLRQGSNPDTNSIDNLKAKDSKGRSIYKSMDDRVSPKECAALRQLAVNRDANGKPLGFSGDLVRKDNLKNGNGMICPCAPKPGLLLERIVFCLGDAPDGLFFNVTQDLIARTSKYYWQVYLPIIMFAVGLFGWKMATGGLRSLPKETFLFAVKLGAVVTFLAWFPVVHSQILRMTQFFAEMPADAMAGFSDICNLGSANLKPNLWAQWDCVFGKLIGFSVADPNQNFFGSGLSMGIISYLVSYLFLPGSAMIITMTGIGMLFTLFAGAVRAVNTYLMAIIAIAFLVLLAPFFVPLILFGGTTARFDVWFKLLIGYMLQPMMLTIFMGIMMIALQYSIFQGPASLFGTISNTEAAKPRTFAETMYINGNGVDISKNFRKEEILKTNLAVNPEKTLAKPGQPNSLKYGEKQGDTGVVPNIPLAPSGVDSGKDNIQGGFEVNVVDPKLAEDLSKRSGAVHKKLTWKEYLEKVILQFLVTNMLALTLFTMLGAIPGISHSLMGGQSANLAAARIVGQAAAERAKATATQLLKAKKNAESTDAVLRSSFRNMAGKR